MAFIFQSSDQIYAGSSYIIANGDTVFVTDGAIIANDETYTLRYAGGPLRSLLVNYGQIIGHANAVVYMGAASNVLENHGLIRNNDDSSNMRGAVLVATSGVHRIVNNAEITSAGRVVDINGAVNAVSVVLQNHGLMQALFGHDVLRDGDWVQNVTVKNTGTLRGGEMGMSGTGRGWLDNTGRMEVTQIDGASAQGFTMVNSGVLEGWEFSTHLDAAPGEVWIQASETADLIRNMGTIRGDLDASSGDDAVHNSGTWVGDLRLGYGNDTVWGFGGTFDGSIDGGPGDDRILIQSDSIMVIGGAGSDTLLARSDVLAVSEVETIQLLGAGNFAVAGSDGAEAITGNVGANLLQGLGGNDTLIGAAGDDVIQSGEGSDLIYGGSGWDEIEGGDGNDTASGGAGADTLRGGAGNDVLAGEEGNDVLDGGAGNDTLNGGLGWDSLSGGAGNDYMVGFQDNDFLDGGDGLDRLLGGDGDDTLVGGAGDDILSGDSGNDMLTGGTGFDILMGKSGFDTFMFYSLAEIDEGRPDRIKDFERGADVIDVSAIGEDSSFDFIGTSAFSASGGMEVRYILNAFGAAYLYFDATGSGVSDAELIVFNVPGGIEASDLVL
ncbi:calcium-binding protein [Sagittula salina]|uniref:Uncharacterized protein n=1 Tax=Sagittula salina TaxID=2820268 RepID=A0A940MTA6_9RHOB|nr:calcium-binding protein [Sagittula salina]MBP0483597.1 hypothetical protein [Sagittula salina]